MKAAEAPIRFFHLFSSDLLGSEKKEQIMTEKQVFKKTAESKIEK